MLDMVACRKRTPTYSRRSPWFGAGHLVIVTWPGGYGRRMKILVLAVQVVWRAEGLCRLHAFLGQIW